MISRLKKKSGFRVGAFIAAAMISCVACNSDSSTCDGKIPDESGLIKFAIQRELRQIYLEKNKKTEPSVEKFLARFPECCKFFGLVETPWYQVPMDPFSKKTASVVRVIYKLEDDLYVEKIAEFDRCGTVIRELRSYSTTRPESF